MKRILSTLCALALVVSLAVVPAGAHQIMHVGPKPCDVWDFTGATMEGANNHITPAAWVESGELVDGTLSNGTEASFGDLTFVHNANDRVYSAAESADWGGVLGGNAQDKYGFTYDDGYQAQGGWYCNGAGGPERRYIELANVEPGDRIEVYMGSASGDITLHFADIDWGFPETVKIPAKEFAKVTFVAQYTGTHKLWTEAAGKAMWHRVVRYPYVSLSGKLALPKDFPAKRCTIKFINQETKAETWAQTSLDVPTLTFTGRLAPGYTYRAVLTGVPGWGLTADSRLVEVPIADAGKDMDDMTLVVEPKSTYTYSGKVTGFAQGYDKPYTLTMVPEEGSDSQETVLTVAADGSFSGTLDPSVVYTVKLDGAYDYQVKTPLEVTGESAYTEDIVVEPKATYPVSGQFLGVEPGTVRRVGFVNLEDGYIYDTAAGDEGYAASLRPGSYSVHIGCDGYETTSHVVVTDEPVDKDLWCVSTAQKPAVAWTSDVYVGYRTNPNNYETVREAMDAVSRMGVDSEAKRVTVHIAPGTYREQVIVDTPYVSFVNDEPSREVLLTWYYGIGYKYYSAGPDGNGYYDQARAFDKFEKHVADRWGTAVRIMPQAVGFRAENITFENSFNRYITDEELADGVEPEAEKPPRNYALDVQSKAATERAAAICVEAPQCEFLRCKFLSSQDTLYTASDAYFKNCLIEGNTDYIFGSGNVVFDGCELRWKGYSEGSTGGYITAARQESDQAGYLFRSCAVTANDGLTVTPGYFGRPWGADAAVRFQHTRLERAGLIVAEGWTEMSGNKPENARFGERATTDMTGHSMAADQRVVTPAVKVAQVADYLGGWTPHYYTEEADDILTTFASDPILTDNGDINLPKAGHTLTVGYSLGAQDANDASLINWYAVSPDGAETLVKSSAANVSRSYKIQQGDLGCRIKVSVTPLTLSGEMGETKSYTLLETVKEGWNDPGAAPGDVALGQGVNIFLAGDSTVKDYSAQGMYNDGKNQSEGSWGEFLQAFFDPGQVTVVNYAQGGRSTRNFINEGSLDRIAEKIGPGDYLFIQFGHNDASNADQSHLTERHAPLGTPDQSGIYPTTPGVKSPTPAGLPAAWGDTCYTWDCGGTYKWYLKQYIDVARNAGATPVLVTPVARMYYESDGSIRPHHDESTSEVKNNAYCAAVKQLAAEENVLCVDAFSLTEKMFVDAYKACGKDTYGQQTMSVGESTHSNKLGGMIEAALMARAIQGLGLDISYAVKAPAKVLGQTPKGETAFLIDGQGRLTVYDMLTDYAEKAPYWEGVGQGLFDAIATDRPAGPQVPDVTPTQPAPVQPAAGTYTVQKGDSLWSIAQRLYGSGMKYALLFEANRDKVKDPNAIFVGQVLIVPEG